MAPGWYKRVHMILIVLNVHLNNYKLELRAVFIKSKWNHV